MQRHTAGADALIANIGRVYYRPRSGRLDCTPRAKSDVYDYLVCLRYARDCHAFNKRQLTYFCYMIYNKWMDGWMKLKTQLYDRVLKFRIAKTIEVHLFS